jgi:hypothetical protein
MGDFTLNTTGTREIAERMLNSLQTTNPGEGISEEEFNEGRIRFVQSIFDEFRHQIIFREPSIN